MNATVETKPAQLSILGVSHLSDLYPNVKYRIALIDSLTGLLPRHCLYDLGPGGLYKNVSQGSALRTLLGLVRIAVGTLWVVLRFLLKPTPQVYICYPAPLIAILLGCIPKALRPRMHLDAFISLYDTVVHDRQLLRENSWLARCLYWLERRAFALAHSVVVDTGDNARYYAKLFDLAPDRFRVIALSIPPLPLPQPTATATQKANATFTCLFIGSLVPLHGIGNLLAATQRLASETNIEFIIMGDGQDGLVVERFMHEHLSTNIKWLRGTHSTTALIDAIAAADLCLGVFGSSNKAARVLPYKLYYYSAMARPFVTLRTPCLQTHCGEFAEFLLTEAGANIVDSLVAMIRRHRDDPTFRAAAALNAHRLFQQKLSPQAAASALAAMFNDNAAAI